MSWNRRFSRGMIIRRRKRRKMLSSSRRRRLQDLDNWQDKKICDVGGSANAENLQKSPMPMLKKLEENVSMRKTLTISCRAKHRC